MDKPPQGQFQTNELVDSTGEHNMIDFMFREKHRLRLSVFLRDAPQEFHHADRCTHRLVESRLTDLAGS